MSLSYYERNIDAIKARFKRRYEEDKEKFKERMRNWYHNNKDRILSARKLKVSCLTCHRVVSQSSLKRHLETCDVNYKNVNKPFWIKRI